MSTLIVALSDPSILAAFIAAGGSAVAGTWAWISSRAIRREDMASKNLAAQLQGWMNFSNELQEQLKSLHGQINGLEQRTRECEADRRRLRLRINELELKFNLKGEC